VKTGCGFGSSYRTKDLRFLVIKDDLAMLKNGLFSLGIKWGIMKFN
jgi:hypothetical protein